MTNGTYRFNGFELVEHECVLRCAGAAVDVEPRVLDLLFYLARHRERVVPKGELLDQIWSDVVVSEGSLIRAIHRARHAVGDDGERQDCIRTVRGRGFQFVAPLDATAGQFCGALEVSLVGREAPWQRIVAALDATRAGLGRLVMISGESGIGKTRLASEAMGRARARGMQASLGRCRQNRSAPPFHVLREAFAGLTARDDAHPPLTAPIPEESDPESARIEQQRFTHFDGVARFLAGTSVVQPVLLVLDDLQWADRETLRLIEFLAEGLGETRLCILGTYRAEEVGPTHELSQSINVCEERATVERVVLSPLGREPAAQLVAELRNATPSAAELDTLMRRTGGNPFLLTELATAGDPVELGGESGSAPGARALVRGRLGVLSDETRRLLTFASVAGREFESELLVSAQGGDRGAIDAGLAEARKALVIEATARPGRHQFRHDLLREALYAELSDDERAGLHDRLGVALEGLYGATPDAPLDELAHHFALADGDPSRAISWTIRAGESALDQRGYERAAEHLEAALAGLNAQIDGQRLAKARVLLSIAEAHQRSGEPKRAMPALHEAAQIAREQADRELLLKAASGLRLVMTPIEVGRFDVRDAYLLCDALDAVEPGDTRLGARLLARLAVALYWTPLIPEDTDPLELLERMPGFSKRAHGLALDLRQSLENAARSRRLAEEAVVSARESGSGLTLAYTLNASYLSHSSQDVVDERRGIRDELVRLADEGDDLDLRLVAHAASFIEELQAADRAGIDKELRIITELGERLRYPSARWQARLAAATHASLLGRLDRAEELANEAHAIGRFGENPRAEDTRVHQLFTVRRLQGRAEEFTETLRHYMAGPYGRIESMPPMVAIGELDAGNEQAARMEYEWTCADDFARIRPTMLGVIALVYAAEVCIRMGDGERAVGLYERLLPHAGRFATLNFAVVEGPVSRLLGRLASLMGDHERAMTHLDAAILECDRVGASAWKAISQCDAAQVLHAHDAPGDRERAARLARKALPVASLLGLAPARHVCEKYAVGPA